MKRKAIFYFIKDILSSFTASTEPSLIGTFNKHLVSKGIVKSILKDEIVTKSPPYHLLKGILMVQNNYLWQFPQSAFYEILDILPELKYCLKVDKRRTINKLGSQVILRLFATLYFEFIMLPIHYKEDMRYINKFKEQFTKEDILVIMKNNMFLTRFLFQQHGIVLGRLEEVETSLNKILERFYQKDFL